VGSHFSHSPSLSLSHTHTHTCILIGRINWQLGTIATLLVVGGVSAARGGPRTALIPVFPLSIVTAYQYDMAYGNKLDRVRAIAEDILASEEWTNMLALPENSAMLTRQEYMEIFSRAQKAASGVKE
jgi:hypothetical protein